MTLWHHVAQFAAAFEPWLRARPPARSGPRARAVAGPLCAAALALPLGWLLRAPLADPAPEVAARRLRSTSTRAAHGQPSSRGGPDSELASPLVGPLATRWDDDAGAWIDEVEDEPSADLARSDPAEPSAGPGELGNDEDVGLEDAGRGADAAQPGCGRDVPRAYQRELERAVGPLAPAQAEAFLALARRARAEESEASPQVNLRCRSALEAGLPEVLSPAQLEAYLEAVGEEVPCGAPEAVDLVAASPRELEAEVAALWTALFDLDPAPSAGALAIAGSFVSQALQVEAATVGSPLLLERRRQGLERNAALLELHDQSLRALALLVAPARRPAIVDSEPLLLRPRCAP